MAEFRENSSGKENPWLTDEENVRFNELSSTANISHKNLEEKSRLELLASLRKRESEGVKPKDDKEKELIEGLKRTFSPAITENEIDENTK